jgi:hypothetical protein
MLFSFFRNKRHGTRCGEHGGYGRSSCLSMWFSFCCLAGRAQIRQQSDTHVDCLSQCSDLIKMSFQQASIFTDSKVADLLHSFWGLCPSLGTLFVCFLHQWPSWVLVSSAEVTLLLNLENHINTCVVCINCSPKATINILKVSVANLPSFKQNLMQAYCSFNSYHFLSMPRPKMEFTCINVYLTRHYSTVMWHSHIPSRKWLAVSTYNQF